MPLLAEIADKMPTLETLWGFWFVVGFVLAVVALGLSLTRLWAGAVFLVITGCFGVIAAWPDKIVDPEIISELGSDYLFQKRVSGFIPFAFAFIVWGIVASIRRNKKQQAFHETT